MRGELVRKDNLLAWEVWVCESPDEKQAGTLAALPNEGMESSSIDSNLALNAKRQTVTAWAESG